MAVRIETAGFICRIAGVVLIVVGAIHLVVTPLFAGFIEHTVPARAWAVIAEILVTLVGLAMPATLLWAWRARRSLAR